MSQSYMENVLKTEHKTYDSNLISNSNSIVPISSLFVTELLKPTVTEQLKLEEYKSNSTIIPKEIIDEIYMHLEIVKYMN